MKQRLPQVRSDMAFKDVISGALLILEDIDHPISLSVAILIRYEEWDQIANKDVDALDFRDDDFAARDFFDCYTAVSLIKKVESLPTSFDKKAVALEKFLLAEVQCYQTNERLKDTHAARTIESRAASKLLSQVACELKWILKDAPSLDEMHCSFGPGASSSCQGTKVTVADKLNSRPEIGSNLIDLWEKNSIVDPHFNASVLNIGGEICGPFSALDKPHIVNFNKLSFVPKNGKTERAICTEPTLNTYFQSGIGDAIRRRLYAVGLDLGKQHSINAHYARLGSIDGSYATIDLSAASDSISSQLVLEILPKDWFDLLDASRSAYTLLPDGRLLENNKFSSMGNGYTFELESLIFYSILMVVYREMKHEYPTWKVNDFMTFGDDIIVPTPAASKVINYLEVLGFETNNDKTFTQGPFRESCGKDYLNGRLVRPFFIKSVPSDIRDYYSLCNGTRHLARRHGIFDYCDVRFKRGWNFFLSRITKRNRHFGPSDFGDQVLFTNRPKRWQSTLYGLDRCTLLLGIPDRSDQCKYRSNVVLQVCRSNNPSRISLRRKTDWVKTKQISVTNGWCRDFGRWL